MITEVKFQHQTPVILQDLAVEGVPLFFTGTTVTLSTITVAPSSIPILSTITVTPSSIPTWVSTFSSAEAIAGDMMGGIIGVIAVLATLCVCHLEEEISNTW